MATTGTGFRPDISPDTTTDINPKVTEVIQKIGAMMEDIFGEYYAQRVTLSEKKSLKNQEVAK